MPDLELWGLDRPEFLRVDLNEEVWLGNDDAQCGALEIVEAMVFASRENAESLDLRRYATEAEARAGREELVRKSSASMVLS